jgi:hypothetical protein
MVLSMCICFAGKALKSLQVIVERTPDPLRLALLPVLPPRNVMFPFLLSIWHLLRDKSLFLPRQRFVVVKLWQLHCRNAQPISFYFIDTERNRDARRFEVSERYNRRTRRWVGKRWEPKDSDALVVVNLPSWQRRLRCRFDFAHWTTNYCTLNRVDFFGNNVESLSALCEDGENAQWVVVMVKEGGKIVGRQ